MSALGDPDAAADAAQCATAVATCDANVPDIFDGAAIRVIKQANDTWSLNGSTCVRPARPQVTADLVRDRVVRLIPGAGVGLAPRGASLVNIETVMWVDARHRQTLAPVRILGHDVRVTLVLSRVRWRFGDGRTVTVGSPGKRYDEQGDPCVTRRCPDYFGHVYRRPGRVHVNAVVSWTARFTVDGGAGQAIPGTVAGPDATAALVIKQARGVLVPNPGQH